MARIRIEDLPVQTDQEELTDDERKGLFGGAVDYFYRSTSYQIGGSSLAGLGSGPHLPTGSPVFTDPFSERAINY